MTEDFEMTRKSHTISPIFVSGHVIKLFSGFFPDVSTCFLFPQKIFKRQLSEKLYPAHLTSCI